MRSLSALMALLVAGGSMSDGTATPSAPRSAPPPAMAPAPAQDPVVAVHRPTAVAPVTGGVQRAYRQPDGPYGRGHRGVDLRVRPAEPVRAALPGTVRFAGRVAGETWLTLTHSDGLETTYGGVDATVVVGQRVVLGEPLGRMRAGRRHLDWGARLGGGYIDPLGLLAGWRVRLVPAGGG